MAYCREKMASKVSSALECIVRSSGQLNDDTYLQKLSPLLCQSEYKVPLSMLFDVCLSSDALLDFVLNLALNLIKSDREEEYLDVVLSFIHKLFNDEHLLVDTARRSLHLLELLRHLLERVQHEQGGQGEVEIDHLGSGVINGCLLWRVLMSLWPHWMQQSHFWRRSFASLTTTLCSTHCAENINDIVNRAIEDVDLVEQVLLPILRNNIITTNENSDSNRSAQIVTECCRQYLKQGMKWRECDYTVDVLINFGLDFDSTLVSNLTQKAFGDERILKAIVREINLLAKHRWERVEIFIESVFAFLVNKMDDKNNDEVVKLKPWLISMMTPAFMRHETLRQQILELSLLLLKRVIDDGNSNHKTGITTLFYQENECPLPNGSRHRDIRLILASISSASFDSSVSFLKREDLVNFLITKALYEDSIVLNTRRHMLQLASRLINYELNDEMIGVLLAHCHCGTEWQVLDGILSLLSSIKNTGLIPLEKIAKDNFITLLLHFCRYHESPFIRASSFHLLAELKIFKNNLDKLVQIMEYSVYKETEAIARRAAIELIHSTLVNTQGYEEDKRLELFKLMSVAMRIELDEEASAKVLHFWIEHTKSILNKLNDWSEKSPKGSELERTMVYEAFMAAMKSHDDSIRNELHKFLTDNFMDKSKSEEGLCSLNSDFESAMTLFLCSGLQTHKPQDDLEAVLEDIMASYQNSVEHHNDDIIIDCY